MAQFTETDILDAVPRLTRARLFSYLEARIVRPCQTPDGYLFQSIDIARLELLCDLSDDLDLDEVALSVVISLIDQLHAARQDLHAVAFALQGEATDIRQRIGRAMQQASRQGD